MAALLFKHRHEHRDGWDGRAFDGHWCLSCFCWLDAALRSSLGTRDSNPARRDRREERR